MTKEIKKFLINHNQDITKISEKEFKIMEGILSSLETRIKLSLQFYNDKELKRKYDNLIKITMGKSNTRIFMFKNKIKTMALMTGSSISEARIKDIALYVSEIFANEINNRTKRLEVKKK